MYFYQWLTKLHTTLTEMTRFLHIRYKLINISNIHLDMPVHHLHILLHIYV